MSDQDIVTSVKEKYGQAVLRITSGGSGCCDPQSSGTECDPITSNLYAPD